MPDTTVDPGLTATEELVMEVLAARHRTGHTVWPFTRRAPITKALDHLSKLGLVSYKPHNTAGSWAAELTPTAVERWAPPETAAEFATPEARALDLLDQVTPVRGTGPLTPAELQAHELLVAAGRRHEVAGMAITTHQGMPPGKIVISAPKEWPKSLADMVAEAMAARVGHAALQRALIAEAVATTAMANDGDGTFVVDGAQ